MNILLFSPHFPANFVNFARALKKLGARALAIADEPFERLNPVLKASLADYYRVLDLENYACVLTACKHFISRYGEIDRLESFNEHWLIQDAKLRTELKVPGLKSDEIRKIKYKSEMKKIYRSAGLPVARGKVINTLEEAALFIGETGYPVVVKPDCGVGAAGTYKIKNTEEMKNFFNSKPPVDYIMEEFIKGTICSFDGLADLAGNLPFYTSHIFSQGIMETVNEGRDLSYYSERIIPPDLEEAGKKALRAFNVRERFFHLEFFRTEDHRLLALEVNMRPPGGLTLDMFNYANDLDLYYEWGHLVVNNKFHAGFDPSKPRKYHSCFVGRKTDKTYFHTAEDIMNKYREYIPHRERLSSLYHEVLGDYAFILRAGELEKIKEIVTFILKMK